MLILGLNLIMISLLIPVCDYDIIALVHSMKTCLETIPEFTEILVGDDGSSAENRNKYKSLEEDRGIFKKCKKDLSEGISFFTNQKILDVRIFGKESVLFPARNTREGRGMETSGNRGGDVFRTSRY